jgi:hypothetical protein
MRKLIGAVGLAAGFALLAGAQAQVQDTREPWGSAAPAGESNRPSGGASTAAPTAAPASNAAPMSPAEVERLRQRVTELERQNARLQTQAAQPQSGAGVGGAGTAGTGGSAPGAPSGASAAGNAGAWNPGGRVAPSPGTGGAGGTGAAAGSTGTAAPSGAADATGGSGNAGRGRTADEGQAVVTATITGTVQSVSQKRVSILDTEGLRYDLELNARTQLLRNGRPFPLDRLRQGTEVRATYDLVNDPTHATRIEVVGNGR